MYRIEKNIEEFIIFFFILVYQNVYLCTIRVLKYVRLCI